MEADSAAATAASPSPADKEKTEKTDKGEYSVLIKLFMLFNIS